ncbi:hypothetical protein [Sphingomonas psychrolutea]|uniref:hypothetical protein n=1 Tax=Sphingomonas psychrolutea TaxID=1259676 RepID=UPI0016631978|nr:hypothetical protein [Sphingomonas psychrolutea]
MTNAKIAMSNRSVRSRRYQVSMAAATAKYSRMVPKSATATSGIATQVGIGEPVKSGTNALRSPTGMCNFNPTITKTAIIATPATAEISALAERRPTRRNTAPAARTLSGKANRPRSSENMTKTAKRSRSVANGCASKAAAEGICRPNIAGAIPLARSQDWNAA